MIIKKGMSWNDFLQTLIVKRKLTSLKLTQGSLADLFAGIERENLRVETVILNSYVQLKELGTSASLTIKRNKLTGLVAHVWGAEIVINKTVPVHTIIGISASIINSNSKRIAVIMELNVK